MAFDKAPTTPDRTRFDINESEDLRVVKEFEEELKPYMEKTLIIFGKTLTGFNLYLHEKRMFCYSKKYPDGAVCFDNLRDYRFALLKWSGLCDLNERRAWAKSKDEEDFKHLSLATA